MAAAHVSLEMPVDLLDRIRALSQQEERSVSSVIRQAAWARVREREATAPTATTYRPLGRDGESRSDASA